MEEAPEYPSVQFALTVGTWDTTDFACLDTGFEGGLLIPEGVGREIIAAYAIDRLRLPDGSIVPSRTWRGELYLEDHRFEVVVSALGDRFLLGREVLDQMEVCFVFGREVRLRFGG